MPSSGYLSQRLGRLASFSSRRSPRFGAEQPDSKLIKSQVEKLLHLIRVRFGAEQPESKAKALELQKIQFSHDAYRAKLIKRPSDRLEKLYDSIRLRLAEATTQVEFQDKIRNSPNQSVAHESIRYFRWLTRPRVFDFSVSFNSFLISLTSEERYYIVFLLSIHCISATFNDLITYRVLLCYCMLKANIGSYGSIVLGKMIVAGYNPDYWTYMDLIAGLIEENKANHFCVKMEKHGCFSELINPRWLTSGLCDLLIVKPCSSENIDYAVRSFVKMIDGNDQPRFLTCARIIGGLCKVRKIDKALQVFFKYKCLGFGYSFDIYIQLVEGLSYARRWKECMSLMQEILVKDLFVSFTFDCLIEMLHKKGKMKEAKKLIEEAKFFLFRLYLIFLGCSFYWCA